MNGYTIHKGKFTRDLFETATVKTVEGAKEVIKYLEIREDIDFSKTVDIRDHEVRFSEFTKEELLELFSYAYDDFICTEAERLFMIFMEVGRTTGRVLTLENGNFIVAEW